MNREIVHPSTSESEFFFSLLRVTTAQIFRAAGIDRCAPSVLDTATDIMRRHLLLLSFTSKELAEESGRSQVELADVAQAMQSTGLIHPYTTLDFSNGWDIIEKEEELKRLRIERKKLKAQYGFIKEVQREKQIKKEQLEKQYQREREKDRERERELEKEKEREKLLSATSGTAGNSQNISGQENNSKKERDKERERILKERQVEREKIYKHNLLLCQESEQEKSQRLHVEQELKRVKESYDYTTFLIEQAEKDPCMSGFMKFVDWAKGKSAAQQRFVSRPPISASQAAAAAAAATAAQAQAQALALAQAQAEAEAEAESQAQAQTQSQTQNPEKNTDGVYPKPASEKQYQNQDSVHIKSENGPSNDRSITTGTSQHQPEQQPLNPLLQQPLQPISVDQQLIMLQQQQQPHEWLLTLMKKQFKVGFETKYLNTSLALAASTTTPTNPSNLNSQNPQVPSNNTKGSLTSISNNKSNGHNQKSETNNDTNPNFNTNNNNSNNPHNNGNDSFINNSSSQNVDIIMSDATATTTSTTINNDNSSSSSSNHISSSPLKVSNIIIQGGPPTLDAQAKASFSHH